ncbi:hypothetical protein [Desulfofustis glycolicus]|uniref:Uncharacterized protein n=1 Tax=Desulfofustis glycolicus DSM 9705 TaxID=1121409 RepID=A0A1M5S4C3_9BACT|nr:hypothetical protein [Desulfofustis glycolicus]SHH33334.1 hypothetical protein SAMN02745124_00156 [Desulfofustis glycolicus DSM 9705]
MNTPFSFLGAADAYVDILSDTGEATGLELKGDCSEFTPKPDSERKEQTAHGRSNYGQVLASVTLPKPMTATITFAQLDQALFAAAFFGTNSVLTQDAGDVTEAIAVVTIADKWVDIGHYMISAVVVKDETDTTTYTVGDDYEINPRLGMIMAKSDGAIAAGETVHVTLTKAAVSGTIMKGMTKANVRIRVKLDGQNFDDGRSFISEIYQMRLAPTSNFSLIGEDFVNVTFEGALETPAGKDHPMQHIWLS